MKQIQNILLAISLSLIFAGCASLSRERRNQIPGPDGTPHDLIECSEIEYCYKDAAKVCRGTYKIVNTTSVAPKPDASISATVHTMLVKCSKSAVKMAN